MFDLVISVFAGELKKFWREQISDVDLIELLYDAVADPIDLRDENGNPISVPKATASKIMNRKAGGNIHTKIKKHIADEAVNNTIVAYFEKKIMPNLQPGLIDDLIARLKTIIRRDLNIPQSKRDELSDLATKRTPAEFLARTFQYCAPKDNRKTDDAVPMTGDIEEFDRNNPLPQIEYDENVGVDERRYVDALLEVYGELRGHDNYSLDDLKEDEEHLQHFKRQRDDYFAAEAVRRGTRDIYRETEIDQFVLLKNETYDEVIDLWEDDYQTGMKRLRRVLAQAASTEITASWLARDTVWIGAAQKKGICHMLVNENRLKGWVRHE